VAVIGRAKARLNIIDNAPETRKIGFLRQVTDGRAGLDEARPAIRLHEPRRDLEQGRFAGPVAANDAHPLTRPDIEIDTIEKRGAAEGQPTSSSWSTGEEA
jgi:hypothetical protein